MNPPRDIGTIFEPYAHGDAPGAVVGVAQRGRTIFRGAFGLADLESAVANTVSTPMFIGSISKQFTSLAALLLADDLRLELDRGVRTWLPELPVLEGDATLRHLAQHTAGYRCYLDIAFADGFALKPPGAALDLLVRQTGANFAPGAGQLYSNSGYHLLSLVLEKVAGLPFEDLLARRITEPLGLGATKSVRDPHHHAHGIATPYVPLRGGGWQRGSHVSQECLGDGALVSTIDDMLVWMARLRGPHGLGPDRAWSELIAPTRLSNGFVSSYGMGLRAGLYRGVRILEHGGGIMGGVSHMLTAPDHALDVIVMFNRVAAAREHALRIVDVVLSGELGPLARPPRSDAFPALRGSYRSGRSGLVFEFRDVNGTLCAGLQGGPPAVLECGPGRQSLALPNATGAFLFDADCVASVDVDENGVVDRLERLPDQAPEPDPEAQGLYGCPDARAEATIEEIDGRWTLACKGRYGTNSFALEPLARDLLVARHALMPWAAIVELTRSGGAVTGFTITTGRTRRLPFARAPRASGAP